MKRKSNDTWWDEGIRYGWIGIYEQEMIRFLEEEYGVLEDEVRCVAVFTSLFMKDGHTALPLNRSPKDWAQLIGLDRKQTIGLSDNLPEISRVKSSPIVTDSFEMKPLSIEGDMVSFRKIRLMEYELYQWFKRNSKNSSTSDISSYISNLFPDIQQSVPDWQHAASVLSLIKPFLIISGGPGTGKTTTIAKILALNQQQSKSPLNIALAAPTGKAAGRMGQAITRELERLNLSDNLIKAIPAEAKTLHRLLSGTQEYGLLPAAEKKELRYDLIIVDEASMIDLNLMHRLITHLGEKTRLILLGDKDQLASVEAGSVFADLCGKQSNSFHTGTIQTLRSAGIEGELPASENTGLNDSIVYLTKSFRFGADSGIGQLASFIRDGYEQMDDLNTIFGEYSDLQHVGFSFQKNEIDMLIQLLMEKVKHSREIHDPEEMLGFWKKTAWLGVLRRGLTGTERLNRLIEQQIAAHRMLPMNNGWYHGRPVIITQNDYNLEVYNGDAGVCLSDKDGIMRVYVESGAGLRRFKPQRLTRFEPGWFLTVHKSQGSEFDDINLMLPQNWNQLITRELLYTAVTRAKKKFKLYGSMDFFLRGIKNKTVRYTGLNQVFK